MLTLLRCTDYPSNCKAITDGVETNSNGPQIGRTKRGARVHSHEGGPQVQAASEQMRHCSLMPAIWSAKSQAHTLGAAAAGSPLTLYLYISSRFRIAPSQGLGGGGGGDTLFFYYNRSITSKSALSRHFFPIGLLHS